MRTHNTKASRQGVEHKQNTFIAKQLYNWYIICSKPLQILSHRGDKSSRTNSNVHAFFSIFVDWNCKFHDCLAPCIIAGTISQMHNHMESTRKLAWSFVTPGNIAYSSSYWVACKWFFFPLDFGEFLDRAKFVFIAVFAHRFQYHRTGGNGKFKNSDVLVSTFTHYFNA